MDYENEKMSRFNAGMALAERIDQLQRAINSARFNPLAKNPETLTFNFEVIINASNALLNEGWAKLNPKEKEDGKKISETVNQFVKNCPPIKIDRNGELIVVKENYERLLVLLDFYEKRLKEFLDKHNLSSPNIDDDEGL